MVITIKNKTLHKKVFSIMAKLDKQSDKFLKQGNLKQSNIVEDKIDDLYAENYTKMFKIVVSKGSKPYTYKYSKKKEWSKMVKRKTKIVYSKNKQTGKSDTKLDKSKSALVPGKRISKNGNVYYEYRKNRSDKKGKKI